MRVVDVDLFIVENCDVTRFGKFFMLRRELDSMEGTMWMSFAGCRTLCASSLTVAAAVLVPSGNWKILLDMRPVGMRGAVGVPMLDVAALSAMM